MKDKLIWWILPKICRYLTIQGYNHKYNITMYYAIMLRAARNRFTEDNDATLKDFLDECYNEIKLEHL